MKTKILKAFLMSVLISGTFGTSFVQAAVPSDFGNEVDCVAAGYAWTTNSQGNNLRCRANAFDSPRSYDNQADCEAAGYFWSPNRGGNNLRCRLNNFVSNF
ncbi:MAG: hypothetical protein ACJASB_003959 [Shewanella psychromarinicola]|jgi:hypothetical protein|uniref:hypothetical protein n=1 Tax=Shewanella psychromarinicola TaxID=2487742 RepID=UPI003EE88116